MCVEPDRFWEEIWIAEDYNGEPDVLTHDYVRGHVVRSIRCACGRLRGGHRCR
jgi:hypothetical protein